MSSVSDSIDSYLGSGSLSPEEYLAHYGMPRRSGRYPWGSGEDPFQSGRDFLGRVEEMRKNGFKYTDEDGKVYTGDNAIAKSLGYSSTDFRTIYAIAKDDRRRDQVATMKRLRDKEGLSNSEIGRKMGINESTVRSLMDAERETKTNLARNTAKFLKEQVDQKKMVDVGTGVERSLNVTKEKLDQALYILQAEEGYKLYGNRFPQATNKGQMTTQRVLCTPDTPHSAIYDFGKVQTLEDYITRDGGETYEKKFNYPASMDSKRLKILYNEEGGLERDGTIRIRPGVKDLCLGESNFAQVRIMVDHQSYLKGMAVYGDPKEFPDGVDVIFNTNKTMGTPMRKVLKDIKADPDNPFGALIKEKGGQYWYTDDDGKKKLGLINKTREEGEWSEWKDSTPAQFLSKQSESLAKRQLNLSLDDKKMEYDEIMSLNNPTVKKYYLNKFAEACDKAAEDLKGAALPGQKFHVILPINSLSDKEVYAPGYEDGTKLALIRYPHGGTFEIPILTVNNKNKEGVQTIGKTAMDAIGITHAVADRLSGADFDGDSVMAIPTNSTIKINTRNPLKGLEGFDPKMEYGGAVEVKDDKGKSHWYRNGLEFSHMKMTDKEMGIISNLITDMTLAGADDDKLARAVRHSMVVIDAEKHHLDYKASEKDNNIAALRREFQRRVDPDGTVHEGGASTLISKAKSPLNVPKRQGSPKVNIPGKPYYDPSRPDGALLWTTADDLEYTVTKTNKRTGKVTTTVKQRITESTKMRETDDANTLVSQYKHPMELIYADYANGMKHLANQARVSLYASGKIAYDKKAKEKYKPEVDSLMEKLDKAESNTPKERAANRIAVARVIQKQKEATESGKEIKAKDVRKMSQQALTKAREEVGSVSRRDRNIVVTDKEWEAIQAGAVSESVLKRVLNNCDPDSLREKAMPKTTTQLTQVKIDKIKSLASSYTIGEIASKLGISTSTVNKYLKGEN